ncbi:MAG: response regulator [Pseudomonadota bacterium]
MNTPRVPLLLVDDRVENLVALKALLEQLEGIDVSCASGGEEALRMLLKHDYALVLMDVQMPGMDGFETATLMRANPKTRHVPIVFVTAHDSGADIVFRGYESGAVDYLVKPVVALILHAKVRVFAQLYRQRLAIAAHERQMSELQPDRGARSGPLRLLLVDDRPENLMALDALLEELGDLQLVHASSGPQALQAALLGEFAAILLDVQMPVMDGFQTAELLRADPRTSAIPILFVTAGMGGRESQFKGYELGAVDYLVKPLEPHVLRSKVRVFCDLYRQRVVLEQHGAYLAQLVDERTVALARSNAHLADSRERYQRLLGALTKQLFSVQRAGQRLHSLGHGEGCEAVTGYPQSAFAADPALWLAIVPEEERAAVQAAVEATLAGRRAEQVEQLEHRLRCGDGNLRWVRSTFVLDAHDGAPLCDVLMEDIDARRRAEDERARLVDTLALATRAARLGVWDWDLHNQQLVWDERMYSLCGVRPGQLGDAHQTWLATTLAEDQPLCEAALRAALEVGAAPYAIEFRVRWPDGSLHYLQADGEVVRDGAGRVLRMTGVHADITERKEAETELRRHRDNLLELVDERTVSLGAIVDNAADGIITIDVDGHILSFNRAAERMFGYRAAQAIGQDVGMLMPAAEGAAHGAYLRHYRARGSSTIVGSGRELQGRRADGQVFPLYLAVSAMEVAGRSRFTGILRDISAQKAGEASLVAARQAAETANRVKSEFLAKMSHELRTPLNAVIGFSGLMRNAPGVLPEHQANLQIIHRSGQHLLTLINDVLELSKIEAGRMRLVESENDLDDLLCDVIDMLRMRAQQGGLALQLVQHGVPAMVRVDGVKLRQVLINLVGNAIKFTVRGSVRLEVHGEPSGSGVLLRFAVRDTGIGIASADREAIFEPFVQAPSHASEAGTGLGLTISRQYVDLMGGTLELDTVQGEGSTFRFALTLALAEDVAPAAPAGAVRALPEARQGTRVLIADDDEASRNLLAGLLVPAGFTVLAVADGIAALESLATFDPQLILMDWRMPRLDGLETIRRMRAGSGGAALRIIMCSASAFEEECQLGLEVGADAFLRKPLDEAQLYGAIEQLLAFKFERDMRASGAAAPVREAPMRREELASLALSLRAALRDALMELNHSKMDDALSRIVHQDAALGPRIAGMIAARQFRELVLLLEA